MKFSLKRFGFVIALVIVAFLCCTAEDCGSAPPSDRIEQQRQEAVSQQATSQVGMPGVSRFTEKKLMKMLYELRDQNVATYTYIPDMNGRLWHLCDSIGYGLPYGTQFSNPEKVVQSYSQSYGTLPQSEPNGLFMPPTADGTWVMCGTDANSIKPVLVEPRIISSPVKLQAVGEYAAK